MHVVYYTMYFPPEPTAAATRAWHFAKSLTQAGHTVTVITGMPNHPGGVTHQEYRRRVWAVEQPLEGLRVQRGWVYVTKRKSGLARLLNHSSFALSAGCVSVFSARPSVIVSSVPPLFHGLTANLFGLLWRAPIVLDSRDDWPRAAIMLGQLEEGHVVRILQATVARLQRRARRIVCVTSGMRDRFVERGIQATKIELIRNGADTEIFAPGPLSDTDAPFTVLYAGTHGHVHGMEAILSAAELLSGEDVRFRFVGAGVMRPILEARAQEAQLTAVSFEDPVSPEQLVPILAESSVCLATTASGPLADEVIPVKMFDYMASGRPVIGALSGEAAEILTEAGAGVVVPPEDAVALARAIRGLMADRRAALAMGQHGAVAARSKYSREVLGQQFVDLIGAVAAEEATRRASRIPSGVYRSLKRLLDLLCACLLLVVLSPLLLAIVVAIRLDSPGPAIFRQRRSGRWAEEFVMFKFRTMPVDTPDVATHLLDQATTRATKLGTLLRRLSLDELPQLWNVAVGQMSIIGPRPALYNQYDLIAMRVDAGVDALRPGLTGWAQVNGRDEIPMPEKVALDQEYAARSSLWFDAYVVWRTIATVLGGRGAR